jgi:hypothetical protein
MDYSAWSFYSASLYLPLQAGLASTVNYIFSDLVVFLYILSRRSILSFPSVWTSWSFGSVFFHSDLPLLFLMIYSIFSIQRPNITSIFRGHLFSGQGYFLFNIGLLRNSDSVLHYLVCCRSADDRRSETASIMGTIAFSQATSSARNCASYKLL